MADTASTTRRSALASAAAVALTPFTPAPFTAAPSYRGRQLLLFIAILRRNWRTAPDERAEPVAFAVFEGYVRVVHRAASALAAEIAAQPVRTLDDILDRVIVAAWGRADVPMDTLLEPILQLGGVAFEQCEHVECAEAA